MRITLTMFEYEALKQMRDPNFEVPDEPRWNSAIQSLRKKNFVVKKRDPNDPEYNVLEVIPAGLDFIARAHIPTQEERRARSIVDEIMRKSVRESTPEARRTRAEAAAFNRAREAARAADRRRQEREAEERVRRATEEQRRTSGRWDPFGGFPFRPLPSRQTMFTGTPEERKALYRKLVMQHHPDRQPESKRAEATKKLAEINAACAQSKREQGIFAFRRSTT